MLLLSLIQQCIIEHGRVCPRDKTGTQSKDELCSEESPESISEHIVPESDSTDDHTYQQRSLATEHIREVSSRDLKQYYPNSKSRLY